MTLDPFLLEIIVCPETRAALTPADAELVRALDAAAARGALFDKSGKKVKAGLSGALVRQDNEVAYPVFDGIPHLLEGAQIALRQIRG